ncbi:MAG: zinc/manganese transport system permease protein, partial [Thermoleophilaceae bacterium]|nr:zinc/manganese transport system permease protein [Thermoleophilaceae bacterium]
LYPPGRATGNSTASVTVLFGSIFGISGRDAVTAAVIAAGLVGVVLLVARPLLFASLDPAVAAARGVPVRLLGPMFLGVVGASAAEASQVVGALLLFGLLAAPPAAAQRLTDRPWRALALSAVFATASVWIGLTLAYAYPILPPSFAILAVSTALYAGAAIVTSVPGRGRTPRPCG